jgi:hypothetical protein
MDARADSAAGTRPQDRADDRSADDRSADDRSADEHRADDRSALREMKEESDHLNEVVGQARDAVREAQKAETVGTEQSSGQAETGAVGGDAEDDSGGEDEAAATDNRPDADTRESQKPE